MALHRTAFRCIRSLSSAAGQSPAALPVASRIVVDSTAEHGPPRKWFLGGDHNPALEKTPIVGKLWSLRIPTDPNLHHPEGHQFLSAGHESDQRRRPSTPSVKTPSDSRVEAVYSFAKDPLLSQRYLNPWGMVRFGKILEDLDALAGTVAYLHCDDNDPSTYPNVLVTASVDRILVRRPLTLTSDLILRGAVTWVGRSSMNIRTTIGSGEDDNEALPALVANFTYVARDPMTGKSAPVNKLTPETEEEKRLFSIAECRTRERKAHRANVDSDSKEFLEWARCALEATDATLKMPALSNSGVLSSSTQHENVFLCQPQQQNLHGRIFGGFLMRRAYEVSSYCAD
mmetsp:Transcript_22483/g.54939  ORF Transcript_22483/g.54939 Transcript_22483/m.54939 type:complete len:343 (+) Transcript_22483:30-1058(+)